MKVIRSFLFSTFAFYDLLDFMGKTVFRGKNHLKRREKEIGNNYKVNAIADLYLLVPRFWI